MTAPYRLAVLSPHRDDAAFSCGLLCLAFLLAGAQLTVVNVCTVSDYTVTPERFAEARTAEEKTAAVTEARLAEDESFVSMLIEMSGGRGDLQLHDLGWKDAPLRLDIASEATLDGTGPHRTDEIAALSGELKFLREFDAVAAPLALGGHIDHRLVRAAAERTVSADRLCLYEDLPYAARLPEPHRAASLWSLALPGAEIAKRRLALCYPSQIAPAVADEIAAYAAQHGGAERFVLPPGIAASWQAQLRDVAILTESR